MRRNSSENGSAQAKDKIPAGEPRLAVLALMTLAAVALCIFLAVPFLPALGWALALAIVAVPLHRYVRRWLSHADLAAGVSTALVLTLIGVPSALVVARLTAEARQAAEAVEREATTGEVGSALDQIPYAGETVDWVRTHVGEAELRDAVLARAGDVSALLQGSLWAGVQLLLMALVLFYFLRDGHELMNGVKGLAPMTPNETERLSCRVQDSVYATIYGTFVTGILQGVTGGLLFWWLGLPAPVLWGTIMFVLGILPMVGGVLVWLPAAAYLALTERIGAAALLVVWGTLMAGPISNFVYGSCAGGRMRLHPLPTLFAYIGGLAVFGITGMVLGPVVLALTLGLIDVWRGRMTPEPIGTRDASQVNVAQV